MSYYFRNVPNFNYVSRLPEKRNLDDYIEVKNLFKRGKIRDDIFLSVKYFIKYDIIGDERPDQVAEKVYGDPSLDWLVLLSNNILNVYEQWPKTQLTFDKYLLEKYGTYENLYGGIHHYKTLEYKTSTGITILPAGRIVTESFYKAPEYQIELDKSIRLPEVVPGVFAEATSTIQNSQVNGVTLINPGLGYTQAIVTVSEPPVGYGASAAAVLSVLPGEREVASITIIDKGRGYVSQPFVSFSAPPPTIPPTLTAVLGVGGSVSSVSIGNSGDGYTFTPTLSFSQPEDIIGNAVLLTQSPYNVRPGFEGIYFKTDGTTFFTAHGSLGYTQGAVDQYDLSTAWDPGSSTYIRTFNLDSDLPFSYITGIEFRPNGRSMFVTGLSNSGYKIAEYSLFLEWNIASASYLRSISTTPLAGIRFQDNGRAIFVIEETDPDTIKKYRVITPWNINTAQLTTPLSSFNVFDAIGDNNILGFNFSESGEELYVSGSDTSKLYVFKLPTAWDLSTVTYFSELNTSTQDTRPVDAYINPERTKLIIAGNQTRKLYTYDIDLVAKGYATLSGENIGSIVITDPGYSYINPPTITIQPPIPARTTQGYAVIANGKVDEIILTDPGYNYNTAPTITIDSPPVPIQAEIDAVVEGGTVIDLIIKNPGRGYEEAPILSFSKPNNLYEPQVDEIFESNGIIWKYDGYNWKRKTSDGILYYDESQAKMIELSGRDYTVPVTNYEYESELEDKKRHIYVLKPDYLNIVFNDLDTIMPYKKGSEQYVSRTLKQADNPRFYE